MWSVLYCMAVCQQIHAVSFLANWRCTSVAGVELCVATCKTTWKRRPAGPADWTTCTCCSSVRERAQDVIHPQEMRCFFPRVTAWTVTVTVTVSVSVTVTVTVWDESTCNKEAGQAGAWKETHPGEQGVRLGFEGALERVKLCFLIKDLHLTGTSG